MKRALLKGGIALLFTLAVNGMLAVSMAFWAGFGDSPRKPARPAAIERPVIQRTPPKKKKKQKQRSVRTVQAAAASALPVMNIPSAIAAPVFETEQAETASVLHPPKEMKKTVISSDAILTEDMLDESPRPTHRTPLRYPKDAERDGIEGAVEARLLLDVDGSVRQVTILKATPPGVFDAAAKEALMTWRFSPATFQGRRLKAWVRQRLVFRLH
jgi:periplasmic protein TonB